MKKYNFSEEYVREHRTFPTVNTVVLACIVVVQIALLAVIVTYTPTPQDVIKEYNVTVTPQSDGSLDIEYHIVWETIDDTEALTWVEIGMANTRFTVYEDSVSPTVHSYKKEDYGDGYVYLRLDFTRHYIGGEIVEFSFKINQKGMLCRDENGYFYEFVPGWFNATPVSTYNFRWQKSDLTSHAYGAVEKGEYYVWRGGFECGGYEKMCVRYDSDAFAAAKTSEYYPFDDSGAYNELREDKIVMTVFLCIVILALVAVEVYIIDSYVSYNRGRGFLTGYGHHVHVYGRSNPHYVKERDRHAAEHSGGGFHGGGCACACACACAGGGRAGCSQKDTYGNVKKNDA